MNQTQYFCIVWSFVLILYTIYAAIFLPTEQTISWVVYDASKKYPILPFFLALFIGHILWGWCEK